MKSCVLANGTTFVCDSPCEARLSSCASRFAPYAAIRSTTAQIGSVNRRDGYSCLRRWSASSKATGFALAVGMSEHEQRCEWRHFKFETVPTAQGLPLWPRHCPTDGDTLIGGEALEDGWHNRSLSMAPKSTDKLPNFFLVGTQKAGTWSLYAYLAQHPQVFMSPVKEPGHFAPEQCREPFIFHWDEYVRLFDGVSDEIAIGEATATYLWSETAPHNISARFPQARIIIILRDPADRAYSQYLYMLSAGRTCRSFRQQIDIGLKPEPQEFSVLWPFLELGFYHDQVERYLRVFPRAQIHIAYYEDLQERPASLMQELFSFLGVDPEFVPNVHVHHNAPQVAQDDALGVSAEEVWAMGRPASRGTRAPQNVTEIAGIPPAPCTPSCAGGSRISRGLLSTRCGTARDSAAP